VGWQLKGGFALNPETCLPYGFQHLAIDPTDDDIVFAAMEIPNERGRVYRTSNGGATWSEVLETSRYVTGVEVSAVDPNVVVLAAGRYVYKSGQKGVPGSWRNITPPDLDRARTVALSPHDADVFVVGSHDQGIYYTADGGRSWQNNQLEGFFEQRLYQGSEEYLPIYIATASNSRVHPLRNVFAVVFDPITPDVFYVAGTQYTRASFGVAKITDGGRKWQRLLLEGLAHRNVFDLAVDSSGTFLYAGTFDGTYRFLLRQP
jgi:hypothetical protein